MKRSTVLSKNYRVEAFHLKRKKRVLLRGTTTPHHAIKHACFVSELPLQVIVRVVDNRTEVEIFSLPAIDADHAIKPKTKRDRKYYRKVKGTKG